jgi:putative hemolysin
VSPTVWVVLVVLIAANALYVAAEFGAVGVRRSRVRRLAEDGHWLAQRLLPHVDDPIALDRYVGASQVGITVSSLMVGAYAQATITRSLAPIAEALLDTTPAAALSIAAVVVLVGLTGVQLILGELVPKALALQYPTETALATVLPMRWSLVVFRPIIAMLNGAASVILRLLGAPAHGHQHLHSPEEIDLLIAESRDGGLLEPQEQQRLSRALHLGRHKARDLMVPCDRLTMIESGADWHAVLQTVSASPFSRIPIFKAQRNAIVGMLRVKDLVDRYASEGPVALDRLMRPVLQIQDDLPADRVLTLLRERRSHSAVIINRQGAALGLITIQDVLGELLGLVRAPAAPHAGPPRGRP